MQLSNIFCCEMTRQGAFFIQIHVYTHTFLKQHFRTHIRVLIKHLNSGFKLPFSVEAEVHPKPINKSSPAPPIGVLAERPREFCDMCHPHLRAVIVASHVRGLELGVHMLWQ